MSQTPPQPPLSTVPSSPPPASGPVNPVYVAPPGWEPRHKGRFRRVFAYLGWLLFLLLLVANVYVVVLANALASSGMDRTTIQKGEETQVVATYTVSGMITQESADEFARFVRAVQGDPNVKAIVLRVNSPGGGVAASDQIHHNILLLKNTGKPIVVSMGALAASGGYMISAPADEIFAEPGTLTGSIGVIAMVPNFEGTMDKIGMKILTFKSTDAAVWKDQLNQFRTPKEYERKRLVDMLNTFQEEFQNTVVMGRGKRLKTRQETVVIGKDKDGKDETVTTTEPFNGKAYLTKEALALGLIDKVGYLSDALKAAAKRANLDKPKVVRYTRQQGLITALLEGPNASSPLISPETLDRLQTPRFMLLWRPEW